MAVLTLNPTVAASAVGTTSFGSSKYGRKTHRRDITGAGVTRTAIQAAVTGSRHVITGGRVTVDAGCTIAISSHETIRDSITFIVAGTATWPVDFETATGESLQITNATGANVSGWIEWVTIPSV